MVPRPGMMTILLILILGRLGRTAKPGSPNSATRPATPEHAAQLTHGLTTALWPVLLMPGSTSPSLPGTACWPRATLRCAAGRRNLLTSGLERRDRSPPTTPPRARGRLAMVGSAAVDWTARPASQTPLLLSLLRCAARKRCLLVGGLDLESLGGHQLPAPLEGGVWVDACNESHS